jgi:hypothetical protein
MREVRITTQEWPPALGLDLDGSGSFTARGFMSEADYEFCVRVLAEWKRVQGLLQAAESYSPSLDGPYPEPDADGKVTFKIQTDG